MVEYKEPKDSLRTITFLEKEREYLKRTCKRKWFKPKKVIACIKKV